MRYVLPVVAAMAAVVLISGCSGEPTASKKDAAGKSDQAQTTSSHDTAAKGVHGEE